MKNFKNFLLEGIFSDKVDKKALIKVREATAYINTNMVFFSNLLFKLKIKQTNDPACKTMWTDGKSIGYNKDFVNKLDVKEVVFVIIHEIMHNAQLHFLRMKGKLPYSSP